MWRQAKEKKIHLRTFFSVSLLKTQLCSCAQCIYTRRAFKTLSHDFATAALRCSKPDLPLLNIFAKIDGTLSVMYCQNERNGCWDWSPGASLKLKCAVIWTISENDLFCSPRLCRPLCVWLFSEADANKLTEVKYIWSLFLTSRNLLSHLFSSYSVLHITCGEERREQSMIFWWLQPILPQGQHLVLLCALHGFSCDTQEPGDQSGICLLVSIQHYLTQGATTADDPVRCFLLDDLHTLEILGTW